MWKTPQKFEGIGQIPVSQLKIGINYHCELLQNKLVGEYSGNVAILVLIQLKQLEDRVTMTENNKATMNVLMTD